jgi:ribosomal protein S11
MNTKRTLLVSATLWLTAAAISLAANAQMGTWKLNESKSKFSSKARNNTVIYSQAAHDMVKVEVQGVDKNGKAVDWTWTGRFDGKPAKTKGSPIMDTIAYKMIDDHTNELTGMKNGKVAFSGMVKVSKDGKSRTVTNTFVESDGKKHTDKAVYDKQ